MPVPPVVTTSRAPSARAARTAPSTESAPSGTIVVSHAKPASASEAAAIGPARSSRPPEADRSLTVMTTARISSAPETPAANPHPSPTALIEEVGAALAGALEGLLAAPLGDLAVVAAQQHVGNREAAPLRGLRVDGVLEHAELVRLLDEALGVADDARDEPSDGLDHRHRGDLAAVQHVVADAHEAHAAAGRVVVDDALVDALVPPAREDELLLACELARRGLREHLARGRRHDEHGVGREDLVEG